MTFLCPECNKLNLADFCVECKFAELSAEALKAACDLSKILHLGKQLFPTSITLENLLLGNPSSELTSELPTIPSIPVSTPELPNITQVKESPFSDKPVPGTFPHGLPPLATSVPTVQQVLHEHTVPLSDFTKVIKDLKPGEAEAHKKAGTAIKTIIAQRYTCANLLYKTINHALKFYKFDHKIHHIENMLAEVLLYKDEPFFENVKYELFIKIVEFEIDDHTAINYTFISWIQDNGIFEWDSCYRLANSIHMFRSLNCAINVKYDIDYDELLLGMINTLADVDPNDLDYCDKQALDYFEFLLYEVGFDKVSNDVLMAYNRDFMFYIDRCEGEFYEKLEFLSIKISHTLSCRICPKYCKRTNENYFKNHRFNRESNKGI